jgi:metal-responsive CopG/Arc/MetJ family transcriptional regulator
MLLVNRAHQYPSDLSRSELIRKAIRLYIEKLEEYRDKATSEPPKPPERIVKLYI